MLFYVIPFKKNCYITCTGKKDGMGAQAQAIYSAMLYCKLNKIPYCHTPLKSIAHNTDNNPNFTNEVEQFFNFGEDEIAIKDVVANREVIDLDNSTFKTFFKILKYLFTNTEKYIFSRSHFHNYINQHTADYPIIQKELRRKFYKYTKPNTNIYNGNEINIAVHLRRGDVSKSDENRFTNNLQIFQLIQQLNKLFSDSSTSFKIHIFSQGKEEEFTELKQYASVHLNGNIFDDFMYLTKADILFMAKSSYSYCAALLSEGLIIYEPFWHPPLKEWKIIDYKSNISADLKNEIKNYKK